ncbi:MAG: hypothetical protein ACLR0U_20505 [Enterocloster clostridioformis]
MKEVKIPGFPPAGKRRPGNPGGAPDQYVKALGDEAAAGRIKRKAMAGAEEIAGREGLYGGELEVLLK